MTKQAIPSAVLNRTDSDWEY